MIAKTMQADIFQDTHIHWNLKPMTKYSSIGLFEGHWMLISTLFLCVWVDDGSSECGHGWHWTLTTRGGRWHSALIYIAGSKQVVTRCCLSYQQKMLHYCQHIFKDQFDNNNNIKTSIRSEFIPMVKQLMKHLLFDRHYEDIVAGILVPVPDWF